MWETHDCAYIRDKNGASQTYQIMYEELTNNRDANDSIYNEQQLAFCVIIRKYITTGDTALNKRRMLTYTALYCVQPFFVIFEINQWFNFNHCRSIVVYSNQLTSVSYD